jgi:signal transduction histidine kinase
MRKRIASRQSGNFEIPAIHAKGKKLLLEVFAKEITYSGKQVRMIALRDISERKKAEAEIIMAKEIAENSEKLKSEFLAQMSHEIRTPINAILSFSSLLREEIGNLVPKELGGAFNIMNNAGQRIIRTIDLILNMSEIQTGTFTPEIREFDIFEDVLIPLSTQYKMICKEKGLKIRIKRAGKNFMVNADEYTITQIFDNLLGNAVKYTLEGEIEINVKRNKRSIRIEISDTGIGISKEYLPNLFQPFTQEEQGYTRKFEGTGLGLALVKKYCDLNNAEIECESEKGKGTMFRITFPVST